MAKHTVYNVKHRHTGQATEHIARLSRDITLEVQKTATLLRQIAEITVSLRSDPTYRILHEIETLNQRLEDIVTEWCDYGISVVKEP